jgi:hypothetical protein
VAGTTQNQALNPLVFLYSQVLGLELGDLGEFLCTSKSRWLPVGFGRAFLRQLSEDQTVARSPLRLCASGHF